MYTRIMAAIDETSATGQVLDTAIAMAGRFGAKLAFCHALDHTLFAQREAGIMLSSSVDQVEDNLRVGAQEFLDLAAQTARSAGIEAELRLVESEKEHIAEMLIQAAADWQADLLVVGMHSRRGVDRFFVGSVAQRLVNKASTSLLLVRSE